MCTTCSNCDKMFSVSSTTSTSTNTNTTPHRNPVVLTPSPIFPPSQQSIPSIFCPVTAGPSTTAHRSAMGGGGLLLTSLTVFLLLLASGLTQVADAAHMPVLQRDTQQREKFAREFALAQYREKLRQLFKEYGDEAEFTVGPISPASETGQFPESLRRELEMEMQEWNSPSSAGESHRQEERELLITAVADILVETPNGARPGFYFSVPDEVRHNNIQRAVVTFKNLPMELGYTLVYATHGSNDTFAWAVNDTSKCRSAARRNRLRGSGTLPLCFHTNVDLTPDMEDMLFTSGHVGSAYKLNFYFIKDDTKQPVDWTNRIKPVMRLKYPVPSRNVRHVPVQTRDCSASPLEACCLVRSNVTLKELGWERQIATPTVLPFNYCRGTCTGTMEHYTTQNAFIRQAILARYANNMNPVKKQAFRPCCAPYSYRPITVYKKGAPGQFVRKSLPDAVVTSCACV